MQLAVERQWDLAEAMAHDHRIWRRPEATVGERGGKEVFKDFRAEIGIEQRTAPDKFGVRLGQSRLDREPGEAQLFVAMGIRLPADMIRADGGSRRGTGRSPCEKPG